MGAKVQEDELSPKLFHTSRSQVCCLSLMKNKDADKKNKETLLKSQERLPRVGGEYLQAACPGAFHGAYDRKLNTNGNIFY